MFKIDIIQIIIEYLYQRFKTKVVKMRLPLYLIYLFVFMFTTMLFEDMMDELVYKKNGTEDPGSFKADKFKHIATRVLACFNVLCSISIGLTVYIQTIKIGLSYWKSLWSYLDFGYGSLEYITSSRRNFAELIDEMDFYAFM